MFSKLKKKIQEENEGGGSPVRPEGQDSASKMARLTSPAPGIASPVKLESSSPFGRDSSQRDVDTMSISSEVSDVKDTASKEDMLKKILKKNEQIKKLESKITELAAMIKERNKNIDRLEKSIEKIKQDNETQIKEITSKFETERNALLEQGSQELRKKLELIQEEKDKLEERLKVADEYRVKFLKQEEEAEEYTGLTTQEMAKVKHMLLNSQAELQTCQEELTQKKLENESSAAKGLQLEKEVQSLMMQISSLTTRSEEIEKENITMAAKLKDYDTVKNELKVKSEELKARLQEFSELQNAYDSLQNSSASHESKMTKLLEEKDDHISHLRDQAETLEQRLKTGELSGDAQTQALHNQVEALETKLQEARKNLSQAKSASSEKVSHLEAQISHLNKQISEDNQELLSTRKELEETKDRLHKQVEDLQEKYNTAEKTCKKYTEKLASKDREIDLMGKEQKSELLREKLHFTSLETELREKINDLHRDIEALQKTRDHEKQATQQKISQLEASLEEWLEKQIDTEKQITGYEDRIQELKGQVREKEKTLGKATEKDKIMAELRKQIEELENQVKSAKSAVEDKQKELTHLDHELQKCIEDKDSSLLRNAQLSQEFESFKRKVKDQRSDLEIELQQKNHSIAGIEQVLQDMQYEAEQNKKKIQDLENQQIVTVTEIESTEIKNLQKEITDLEDQLLDRNKTIKKLQHRMGDLKKTLQKELNIQALPNDESDVATLPANKLDPNKLIPNQVMNGHKRSNSATIPSNDITAATVHLSQQSRNQTYASSGDQSNSHGYQSSNKGSAKNSGGAMQRQNFYQGASDFSASDLESYDSSGGGKFRHLKSSGEGAINKFSPFTNKTNTYAGVTYERDINFDYLKHVIMKFMLSRESESLHLIKAVAVLLDFSEDEQKLMKETLQYKMSWFGTKPSLGQGQFSKFIPPAL